MANVRWFHMSADTFRRAERACEARTAEQPGATLSVLWNANQSQCLVRVDGASKPWRAEQDWIGDCFGIYGRDTHAEAAAMLNGPGWQNSQPVLNR